SRR
ncbi:hypothetical protein CP02DC24_0621B, partial [Chlamydia psittaci 02DC24]